MPEPSTYHPRDTDRLVYAALLGLAVTSVNHLLEVTDLDLPRQIAVYTFATSIPLLGAGLMVDFARRAGTTIPLWVDLIILFGALLSVIGFGAMFFHFGILPGGLFAGAVVLGCFLAFKLRR